MELGIFGKSTTGIKPWFDGTQPCAQTDPEIFFPEFTSPKNDVKIAKAICKSCSFTAPCLEYAVQTQSTGVWGGTTDKERRKFKRTA